MDVQYRSGKSLKSPGFWNWAERSIKYIFSRPPALTRWNRWKVALRMCAKVIFVGIFPEGRPAGGALRHRGRLPRARRLPRPSFRPKRTPFPSFRPDAHPLPVISTGRIPPPVISTEAHPQPSFRPKRSEWRNPAGDGRRADAGALGVDGAPSGFLRFAPARRAGASVEMTGVGTAPARRRFERSATHTRHFDRAEQPALSEVEGSGEIRLATEAGQMLEPAASMERSPDFSPSNSLRACPERSRRGRLLRPGPMGRASGRNDG